MPSFTIKNIPNDDFDTAFSTYGLLNFGTFTAKVTVPENLIFQTQFEGDDADENTTLPDHLDSEFIKYITHAHEQAHWLQYIGTTFGISKFFFVSSKSSLVASNTMGLTRLDSKDLPLLEKLNDSQASWIKTWLQISALNHIWSGGVPTEWFQSNKEIAHPLAAYQAFCSVSKQLLHHDQQKEYADKFEPLWSIEGVEAGNLSGISLDDKTNLGATHLFEAGARISEFIAANHYPHLPEDYMVPPDFFFRGHSKPIVDLFKKITQRDLDPKSLILLAVVIDVALNPPSPPVIPPKFLDTSVFGISPANRFLQTCLTLRDFDPAQIEISSLSDVDQIRGVIFMLYGFFKDKLGDSWSPIEMAETTKLILTPYKNIEIPRDIYTSLASGEIDVRPGAMNRFFLKRAYDAAALRCNHPEFFVIPGLVHSQKRVFYEKWINRLSMPLYVVDGQMVPTVSDPDWLRFFILNVAVNEMTSGAMVGGFDGILLRLRALHHAVSHFKNSDSFMVKAISSLLGDSKFCREVTLHFSAMIASESVNGSKQHGVEIARCVCHFCAKRYSDCVDDIAELVFDSSKDAFSSELIQLLLISFQRLGRINEISDFCGNIIKATEEFPFLNATLRLTLGLTDTGEVLSIASNDDERCCVHYYTGARYITEGRRELAIVEMQNARRLSTSCLEWHLSQVEIDNL